MRLPLIVTLISSFLYIAPVQAIELVRGVRARTVYENSTISSVEVPENKTLGVTTYLKGYSRNRRNDLRFYGQLDFYSSDATGRELNPKLYIGNNTNIVDNKLELDAEISLYRRNLLDNVVTVQEFDDNQDGVETLSYRVAPTYSIDVSGNTRVDLLYSFQGSQELDSADENQTLSNAVEAAWIAPSLNNQFSWTAVTGYKISDFSSDERLKQANVTLAVGYFPRRRWFIGGLVGQDWEDLSIVQGGYQSSNRWSLYTNWNPTRRISTSASFGRNGISGYTSQLEAGLEGQRWDVNVHWSRSSSYSDFSLNPFTLLAEQESTASEDPDEEVVTLGVQDQSPLTLFEQQSVDEEASIAYQINGRRSKVLTELSHLSRNEPATEGDFKALAIRAGFYRDILKDWTVGIQHETLRVRPAASTAENYSINKTELSIDVKF